MTYQLIDVTTGEVTEFTDLADAREATLDMPDWELWHINEAYGEGTMIDSHMPA